MTLTLGERRSRQNYRKLKKRFKRSTSPQNRLAMIDAEKHYKHTLDRKYKNYRKKFSKVFWPDVTNILHKFSINMLTVS
jgi:hypothetical protein